MKVRVWTCICDLGDGSAAVKIFPSKLERDTYIQRMEDEGEYDLSEGGSYEDIDTDVYLERVG